MKNSASRIALGCTICLYMVAGAAARQAVPALSVQIPYPAQLVSRNNDARDNELASTSPPFLQVRGGATKKKRTSIKKKPVAKTATGKKKVGAADKEDKSAVSDFMVKYKSILPLTRGYITLVVVVNALTLALGEELAQGLFALDPMQVMYGMQFWRPLTAASFLGQPSLSWLMNGYYLVQYGSSLERAYGMSQHFMFLITQFILLTFTSMLVGQPFFANSMITSMLHVLSRATPNQKVKWLIFTVPYWSLPYGLMASDVLQAKSVMAALPHIIGILTGHFYHFHKNVWPQMTDGHDWLTAPSFIASRLDADKEKDVGKESVSKALKARKKNKGRKLGSA